MELLKLLEVEGRRRGIDFVLVGGHPLIAWGVPRQTGDVDLLVPERWREVWKEIVCGLGYGTPCEQGGFVQFGPPAPGKWPVDFTRRQRPDI